LAKGLKKGEIAKSISKSPAFVTLHIALLDLPNPIAEVFNSKRAKDVTVINELVTAYKTKPEEVTAWLGAEDQEITRNSVKLLRDFLNDKCKQEQDRSDGKGGGSGGGGSGGSGGKNRERQENPNGSNSMSW